MFAIRSLAADVRLLREQRVELRLGLGDVNLADDADLKLLLGQVKLLLGERDVVRKDIVLGFQGAEIYVVLCDIGFEGQISIS